MAKTAPSRRAIERALAVTADAITATVQTRAKRRTWRAEAETLRSLVETLASTGMAGDVASAVGFELDHSADYFDEDGEHPDHGCEIDYTHTTKPPHAKSGR